VSPGSVSLGPGLAAFCTVLAGLALGCTGTDTGLDSSDCQEWSCTSVLDITFADGRSDFQVGLSGDGFTNYNIACPDGPAAGGPGGSSYECSEGGLVVSWPDFPFPDTFNVSVDSEDAVAYTPDYDVVSACSYTCTSGSIVIE